MATKERVLRKKAKKLEMKRSRRNKINAEYIPALDELLRDIYVSGRPKPSDYYNRKDLVRIFNEMSKEIYGKLDEIPVVEDFGSFLMGIFSAKSDLDLSVNFSNSNVDFPRENKIRTLRKFAKKLYALQRKGHVTGVQPILTAKVPILKVVDRGTGIECDISVENRDGIQKSQIIRFIATIDERFQMLSFLMKAWAKAHDINSSKDRTLNSLSIISLVAFHLQTRNPPILPPFSALFKDGTEPMAVEKMVNNFQSYGKKNKESVGELFISLLVKLASVETLWCKGLCASSYQGLWILKAWDSKIGHISVEDFTDRSQNIARAVGATEVKKIYQCIHLSLQYVSSFMVGQIQKTKLKELLFGEDPATVLVDKPMERYVQRTALPSISLDRVQVKRMRYTEGWGKNGHTKIVQAAEGWGATATDGWRAFPLKNDHTEVVQAAEGWGATATKSWGAFPLNDVNTKVGQSAQGWGATSVNGSGEPLMRGWEGKQGWGSWGGKTIENWGANQQSFHLESLQSKWTQSTGGWCRTQ